MLAGNTSNGTAAAMSFDQRAPGTRPVPNPSDDVDVAEWKRSRANDEVVPSQHQMNGSGSHHSNAMGGSGSRASAGGGVSKVHYITPNASGAAVTTVYTSPESGALVQPSSTVLVTYPPGQGAILPHSPQQNVTYIVVDGNGSHAPIVANNNTTNTSAAMGSSNAAMNLSLGGANYSASRIAGGSLSAMAVAGGSGSGYVGAGGLSGAAVAGNSGSHQQIHGSGHHTQQHGNVRTITIHPSSSHLSDPSLSSGPGSTNDYYPVFVTQNSDHASVTDPAGHSGTHTTVDTTSVGRQVLLQQQQHQYMMAQQQIGGVAQSHHRHPVMLPDGSMVAPHAVHYPAASPQSMMASPASPMMMGGGDYAPPHSPPPHVSPHAVGGGAIANEEAMLRAGRSLCASAGDSSTTTNAAVWGDSAPRIIANSSSTMGMVVSPHTIHTITGHHASPHSPMGVSGLTPTHGMMMGPNAASAGFASTMTLQQQQQMQQQFHQIQQQQQQQQQQQHQLPNRSQFIGGRGRGGGVARMGASSVVSPVTPVSGVVSPVGVNGVGMQRPPPSSTIIGGRGAAGGVGGRGGIVIGSPVGVAGVGVAVGGRPPVASPLVGAPVLGAAPSILIGKLPTPTFTQSICIGGMKIGTGNLVAPRFPGQAEEVVAVKVGGPTSPPLPAAK